MKSENQIEKSGSEAALRLLRSPVFLLSALNHHEKAGVLFAEGSEPRQSRKTGKSCIRAIYVLSGPKCTPKTLIFGHGCAILYN